MSRPGARTSPRAPWVRWALVGLAVVGGLVLVLGVWVATLVAGVRSHLQAARSDLKGVQSALLDGDPAKARREAVRAAGQTTQAREVTRARVWRLAASVPFVDDQLDPVSATAAAVDDVTHRTLPVLVDAVAKVRAGPIVAPGARVDVALLTSLQQPLAQGRADLAAARATIRGSRHGWQVPPLAHQLDQLDSELARTEHACEVGVSTIQRLPGLLGMDGLRRYLLVVQTPAEARGTGGLIGAYSVLTADRGHLALGPVTANTGLRGASSVPVDLGPDFQAMYGDDAALWLNANMSAHFPYAAQIWLELYRRQFATRLDGVVSLDPFAMQYLLQGHPPVVMPDGTRVATDHLATFVLHDIYAKFPGMTQNNVRDAYLARVGSAVSDALLGGAGAQGELAAGLARSVREHRLQAYAVDPAEQATMADLDVAGEVPDGPGPFLGVVLNNAGANKLDYYTHRSVRWELGGCSGGHRTSLLTLTLHSSVPTSGLPPYVVGLTVLHGPDGSTLPTGSNRLLVNLLITRGATVTGIDLDGVALSYATGRERGHPVVRVTVDLLPGQTRTLRLQVRDPAAPGMPDLLLQPVVNAERSVTDWAGCGKSLPSGGLQTKG